MSFSSASSFLTKLAEIFRSEGDSVTADALDRQRQVDSTRPLTGDDIDRVRSLRRKGLQLDSRGEHAKAEPLFAEILDIVEEVFGPDPFIICDHLNDLARCRFNGGNFAAALEDYVRLLRITEQTHGPEDQLAAIVRHQVDACRKGLRDAVGARRLQNQMTLVLQLSRERRTLDTFDRCERLRGLAQRLVTRGRFAAAVRLYDRWIDLRLNDAGPDDELAMLDIRNYALALQQIGDLSRAAAAHRSHIAIRHRRMAWVNDTAGLVLALRDWQACLEQMGDGRSAVETAKLADAVALGMQQAG
jgi:tetratricopeptide (TPR) repeat protein